MTLERLPVNGWADVVSLGMKGWLWLDMAEDGLHKGTLPQSKPAQLTHAWGWSDTHLVRLRFDRDLPGGVVGSRIAVSQAGTPRAAVLWANHGKIRMSSNAFHDSHGKPKVPLEAFTVHGEANTQGSVTRIPVTFYRMADHAS